MFLIVEVESLDMVENVTNWSYSNQPPILLSFARNLDNKLGSVFNTKLCIVAVDCAIVYGTVTSAAARGSLFPSLICR